MLAFNRTYKLPFKYVIPTYTKQYLKNKSIYQRFIKFFKRYIFIVLKGQKNLETFSILPCHHKILWINLSASSLGDSLMDLSSRVMLLDKNVDLFTNKKNKHIYQSDEIFNNVFSQINEMQDIKYNLVILDSYSTRSIKLKSLITPKSPYVGMFGYFNGPEVNRILFSFHQMNNLLGNNLNESEINKIAKVYGLNAIWTNELTKTIFGRNNHVNLVHNKEIINKTTKCSFSSSPDLIHFN
jgi:heptosyltransferase-2